MYAQSLIFLRFGCYVHNPDAIFARNSVSVQNWIENIRAIDPEWSYVQLTGGSNGMSVIGLDVPSTLHQVLLDFKADYTYTEIKPVQARSILVAKRNSFRLTLDNIRKFTRATHTTPAELVTALESYLLRIEVNPVQPVTDEEVKVMKNLGVAWDLAARLPRLATNEFEPVYIMDEHHRVKCL